MKLRILNLARSTTEADLLELFAHYGKVTSCTIIMDKETGLSKGFGFVEIDGDVQGTAAVACLTNTKLHKSKIRVKPMEEKA
jgi:RNA recognition motif-containing protein